MLCEYGCGREATHQLKNGKWCCETSYNKCPEMRKKNSAGLKRAHKDSNKYVSAKNPDGSVRVGFHGYVSWNKGLTKDTDERVKKSGDTYHKRYQLGLITSAWKGKHLPKETREKIRNAALKAHAEGRAHNIGESRWNNKPSYPEQFFMEVIKNEFDDKDYVREYPFHRFSLDFAWLKKKKCIEIDGQQHDICPGYKERDERKDALLLSEGWKVLRIKWVDMYKNTKHWITEAKNFIGA